MNQGSRLASVVENGLDLYNTVTDEVFALFEKEMRLEFVKKSSASNPNQPNSISSSVKMFDKNSIASYLFGLNAF